MSSPWTLLPHFCGGRAFNHRLTLSICWVLCVLVLPACGESAPRGYAGSPSSDTSDTLQPIVAPPRMDESPPLPGTTGAAKTPDGLPALTAKGINTRLFDAPVDNEIRRMERLENAVQELRNDFDTMAPSIVRLVAIEKDIQNLIAQLEVLTGGGAAPVTPIEEALLDEPMPDQPASVPAPPSPSQLSEEVATIENTGIPPPPAPAQEHGGVIASGPPTPATPAPDPKATPPPTIASAQAAPAPLPSGPSVTAVRVGAHPGKMRIVLDVSDKTAFTADLDSEEKILLVELPNAHWRAVPENTFGANPILTSYRTEAMSNGGTRLIFSLKAASALLYSGAMGGEAGNGNRIVIDISAP